jgi:hypothetical protein
MVAAGCGKERAFYLSEHRTGTARKMINALQVRKLKGLSRFPAGYPQAVPQSL